MDKPPKVVVIGGGTGTYSTLLGLRKFPLDLSVIISMTDSGGSNRVIRDEFGLLPTSDLRQAIVALSDNDDRDMLRQLFIYRYSHGTGIAGMTFGNLFMAALTDILGNQKEALAKTCELLHVRGSILPVTFENTNLVARYSNGKQVLGEHQIDEPDEQTGNHKIVELEIFPKVVANPDALAAILKADYIIFSAGDLYTSLIANLVVPGIAKAISKSKAKKIFVLNLMTKFGQTNNFKASDHLFELYRYLDGGVIDFCLLNNKLKFSKEILDRYVQEKATPVIDDLDFSNQSPRPTIVRADLVSKQIHQKHTSDHLLRSLVRHDPAKLGKVLYSLMTS